MRQQLLLPRVIVVGPQDLADPPAPPVPEHVDDVDRLEHELLLGGPARDERNLPPGPVVQGPLRPTGEQPRVGAAVDEPHDVAPEHAELVTPPDPGMGPEVL